MASQPMEYYNFQENFYFVSYTAIIRTWTIYRTSP